MYKKGLKKKVCLSLRYANALSKHVETPLALPEGNFAAAYNQMHSCCHAVNVLLH